MFVFIIRVNKNQTYNVGGQRRQGLFGGPETIFELRPVRGDRSPGKNDHSQRGGGHYTKFAECHRLKCHPKFAHSLIFC